MSHLSLFVVIGIRQLLGQRIEVAVASLPVNIQRQHGTWYTLAAAPTIVSMLALTASGSGGQADTRNLHRS
jgi:hypothetical protein